MTIRNSHQPVFLRAYTRFDNNEYSRPRTVLDESKVHKYNELFNYYIGQKVIDCHYHEVIDSRSLYFDGF